ncbi:MAG: heme-binding protein [Propionicimonas sp.]|uniref:heme-binding protein n=1 Tax=Propionicimonas sp. TaxID=1955623 RepID=UPI003D1219D2
MTIDIPDLERFGHDEAWRLGRNLVEACRRNALPVAVSVHLGAQRAFHAGLPGSSADNDRWAERKTRIVWHFGVSSLEVWQRYVGADGDPLGFLAAFGLPAADYFPAGGAVPIRVRGALVGVLAVSGMESNEDHDLAVAALGELSREGAAE